ncbi:calpain-like protease palB/rim-13 [Massariosphaeria phaeospora]|uniref:Calpain-like protease palB/rim-13 n=1 Tax=Massariosphaeria phaeospora TaxID=100035 RepID=A0A7C8M5L3_9PLEO|nr:calpain-like protease palB/rim-13 [Massariosphaeria phaeospora]
MADSKSAQLQAYKAAASSYQARVQTATTKDEALKLSLSAAENFMGALSLSSSAREKKELKAQCSLLMDVADRIKNVNPWTPLAAMDETTTKNEAIGNWATEVSKFKANSVSDGIASQSNPFVAAENMHPQPIDSPPLDLISATLESSPRLLEGYVNPPPHTFGTLISLSDQHPSPALLDADKEFANPEDLLTATSPHVDARSGVNSGQKLTTDSTTSIHPTVARPQETPSLAPASYIRRLAQPTSSRKLTKKEEIRLWKSSFVNGFKCPPWNKDPLSSEFVLADGEDLFTDVPDLSLSAYQQQFFKGWIRARNALPPSSTFSNDANKTGPSMTASRSIDLVQDAASDCSVVASLCAGIARAEQGHDQLLANLIHPFDKNRGKPVMSSNGKYVVRLNFNGCWRKVVIDDRLPMSHTHRLLHVIDRQNPALLWPALLEKAYLKVRGGYDFPGSDSCSDLWTLTGWLPEQIYLQETNTVSAEVWNRVFKSFSYGDVLVTLGTGKMSTRQERELGLEGQHSYAVLDLKETEHDKLLLIKNPWVEGKGWCGSRPSLGHAPDKNGIGTTGDGVNSQENLHATTFWIGLEQVVQHFESIYLNWNPGLFRHRQDIHFEWTIEEHGVIGDCIVENPQFSFSARKSDVVWLLLCRHFRDASRDVKDESDAFNDGSIRPDSQIYSSGEPLKGYMSIFVCDGKGEQLYIKETYLESSRYVTTPQTLLRWDSKSDSRYTIIIDQDELPASPYTFSLSAFSNSPITLEPATQKYPFQTIAKDVWTKATAGGNPGSLRYFENPQYSVEIRDKSSLAILLTSTNPANLLHVKLVLGHGKRIYGIQRRDILVDSGDHRGGCVFAEFEDIQPGLYTIICSLFDAGQTGDYTLRVDSTSNIVLKQIPRDGAGLRSIKLAEACFGVDVHRVAAPLYVHRLASYTIVARFKRAMSPRSHRGVLARSPLRISVEVGRGPTRTFLVSSESGEYADTATVRSESVNLEPDLNMNGNMWLVLDRLSRPGGPVEEFYEVELYFDVPGKPCSLGVWRNWDD